MSKLSLALDEYLAVRRALGYKLHAQERILRQFVEFADRAGKDVITTDLALRWAVRPGNVPAKLVGEALGHDPPICSSL
jgi:integrase/recombinase XerD